MEHLTEKAMQYNAKPNVVAEVQVNFAEYALRQKGKVAELARERDATGDTYYDRYFDRKRNSCYDGRISRKPAKLPLRSITKNIV